MRVIMGQRTNIAMSSILMSQFLLDYLEEVRIWYNRLFARIQPYLVKWICSCLNNEARPI